LKEVKKQGNKDGKDNEKKKTYGHSHRERRG
jgi:hypothetical protein